MTELGKVLLALGVVLVLVGGVLLLAGRHGGGIPRLPGDLVIERGNTRFVFPLGWSIVLSIGGSILLTLLLSWMVRSRG